MKESYRVMRISEAFSFREGGVAGRPLRALTEHRPQSEFD